MSNARVSLETKEQMQAQAPKEGAPMPPSVVVPVSPTSYWGVRNTKVVNDALPAARVKSSSPMLAPRLQRVMTFIDDNITLDLSVSTLAQVAGMSSFYFCRSFKQSTGITPHQFVLSRRMELARQLLLQEPMRLMQVAQKVGFTDQSQFTRVFRKIVGTTPSQFRRTAGGTS